MTRHEPERARAKGDLSLEDLDRRNRYSREASVYDSKRWTRSSGRYYSDLENRTMADILAPLEDKLILDVAGGTGRVTRHLAAEGGRVVLADFTHEMLLEAARLREREGTRFQLVRGNARGLPFADDTFDAVISLRFFHLLPLRHWDRYLAEMTRVVRPGGLLVLEFDNPFYGIALVPALRAWHRLRTGRGTAENGWLWPHRVGRHFRRHAIVRRDGIYFPAVGRLWERAPRLADAISRTARYRPFCYLTQQVLVTLRKHSTGAS